MPIKINNKTFNTKQEAMRYISNLSEILVIKIYGLNSQRIGTELKDVFRYRQSEIYSDSGDSIKAQIENHLIEKIGRKYTYVQDNKMFPIPIWEVKIETEILECGNFEEIDIYKLDNLLYMVDNLFSKESYL